MATGAAQILLIVGAGIFGLLGSVHLAYTFFTDKFAPRAGAVAEAMKGTSPVLAGATYLWLAYTYWFRIPLAGITAATTCFVSAFLLLTLQR